MMYLQGPIGAVARRARVVGYDRAVILTVIPSPTVGKLLSVATLVALATAGCATSSRSTRDEVLRQIVPSTVQLRCEREGGARRAASGVVVAREGGARRAWIITTRHFLEPMTPQRLSVAVPGTKQPLTARVLKVSDQADLALLQVEDVDLVPARLKSTVRLGDEIWVVAYPWGRRMTLSNGVVSQLASDGGIDYEGPARMVDVSVSYGASGGGVFDAPTGALIGLIEKYRTAHVALPQAPDRPLEIPVPGETTLISSEAIRQFVVEAGLGGFLEN
jgi:S1-C subfamily serine protease